jgi:hypothetical protein
LAYAESDKLGNLIPPLFFTGILSYFVTAMFVEVFGMAISTILVCYIADEEMFPPEDRFCDGALKGAIKKTAQAASETQVVEVKAKHDANKVRLSMCVVLCCAVFVFVVFYCVLLCSVLFCCVVMCVLVLNTTMNKLINICAHVSYVLCSRGVYNRWCQLLWRGVKLKMNRLRMIKKRFCSRSFDRRSARFDGGVG